MESGRNGGAGAPSYLAIKGQGAANPSECFTNPAWYGGEFSPTQLYLKPHGLGEPLGCAEQGAPQCSCAQYFAAKFRAMAPSAQMRQLQLRD